MVAQPLLTVELSKNADDFAPRLLFVLGNAFTRVLPIGRASSRLYGKEYHVM